LLSYFFAALSHSAMYTTRICLTDKQVCMNYVGVVDYVKSSGVSMVEGAHGKV